MKCKVCGSESGKYPLCRACNIKKEKGDILKCPKCNCWHYTDQSCAILNSTTDKKEIDDCKFLYEAQKTLITNSEKAFYLAIQTVLPHGYLVFPQMNLAAFIQRTDNAIFRNELFRNVDFLITDDEYQPKLVIEINDQTHLTPDRRNRDEKVRNICEEAGIPTVTLWTSYGVNEAYIQSRISETLNALPATRVHHFVNDGEQQLSVQNKSDQNNKKRNQKKGCYIATCVYGSYDCPKVWILRRYRDQVLSRSWYGRVFICTYYLISPLLIKIFGRTRCFQQIFRPILDRIVLKLQVHGFEDTPYYDN